MCASESTDPLTLDALRYLQTMAGKQLLADALQGGDSVTAQQALRAHYPADMCRAALALIAARAQVRDKFEHPENLLQTARAERWQRVPRSPITERGDCARSTPFSTCAAESEAICFT